VANALGILGIFVFVACMIALAAAITWVVVKVSPKPKANKPSAS
jgi:hypothetical protein